MTGGAWKKGIVSILGAVILALAASASPALAQVGLPGIPGIDIEAGAGMWFYNPQGWVKYKGGGLDLKDTLGVGSDANWYAWGRFEHFVPFLPNLKVQFTPLNLYGDKSISQSITFGGTTFAAGSKIDSKLGINILDVNLYWPVPLVRLFSLSTVKLDVGVTGRLIDADVRLRALGTTQYENKSLTGFVPLGYLAVRIQPLSLFQIFGEVKGIGWADNYIYDATAGIQVSPYIRNLTLGVGYRITELRVTAISDLELDTRVHGFFIEAGLKF